MKRKCGYCQEKQEMKGGSYEEWSSQVYDKTTKTYKAHDTRIWVCAACTEDLENDDPFEYYDDYSGDTFGDGEDQISFDSAMYRD